MKNDRQKIVEELRYQLRYARTVFEREAIRRELNFWIHHR